MGTENGTKWPICKTPKENACMATAMTIELNTKASLECPKSCKIVRYTGRKKRNPVFKNYSNVEVDYQFPSEEVMYFKEYIIYDFVGLIGSVGGNLGLFIGFSFLDFIFYLINLVEKRFQ